MYYFCKYGGKFYFIRHYVYLPLNSKIYDDNCGLVAVQKEVGIFLAIFDTPLPHVGNLTLTYLTSTF